MAFCLSLEICQAQLFSRTASVSGSSGEGQDKPLLYYQSYGNQIFLLPGLWSSLGHARFSQRPQDGKNWAQIGAVLPQQRARQPGGVWSPEGNEKGGKDPAVLINHRVTPEHQLVLGRADLMLGKGAEQTWGAGKALQEASIRAQHCWAPSREGKSQPEKVQGKDNQKHQGICDPLTKWNSKPVLPLAY